MRKSLQQGHRAEDGLNPVLVAGVEQGAADLDDVSPNPDSVDMGKLADMAADLRGQVGFQVLGPALLAERVGVVLVGHLELELIDELPDARCLLDRAIGQHRLVDRGDLAG